MSTCPGSSPHRLNVHNTGFEDPDLSTNRIRGSAPQTKGDVKSLLNEYPRKFFKPFFVLFHTYAVRIRFFGKTGSSSLKEYYIFCYNLLLLSFLSFRDFITFWAVNFSETTMSKLRYIGTGQLILSSEWQCRVWLFWYSSIWHWSGLNFGNISL